MNEVDQRATKWSLSGRLRHAAVGACDPECEGRCRVCPADAMREAADTLDLFAEAFKDEPCEDTEQRRGRCDQNTDRDMADWCPACRRNSARRLLNPVKD